MLRKAGAQVRYEIFVGVPARARRCSFESRSVAQKVMATGDRVYLTYTRWSTSGQLINGLPGLRTGEVNV
ncbi:hypothetical protein RRG08_049599 [Elysia crispata]|uniref:Uncharacterized protein n=1 Tax=Elysia crispata TaxID=231223 RepID=A0AAE1AUC2_9GAST|nr:hypothetical protein RRG08_049599 [Elysia crispata]